MTSQPAFPARFGRYEVLGLLGEGSMGRVYRGFDPLAQRAVAIKTLKAEHLASENRDEALARFKREARAAGTLAHPAIVTVFDVGDGFFVMELLEGVTLHELLRERGALAPEDALRLLAPVAEALDYAHAQGVVHRDIKPANIMVLADGRPKLMDFGVAHLPATVLTASGQFLGSPSYMAPEQIVRSAVSPATDRFSLAILAYEALTARRPFEGESVTSIIYRVVNETPLPPRRFRPELPAAVDALFARALDKEPERRLPSAVAFVAALATAVGAEAEPELADLVGAPLPAPQLPSAASASAPPGAPPDVETHDLSAEDGARTVAVGPATSPPPARRAPLRGVRWLPLLGAAALLAVFVLRAGLATPPPAPAAAAGLRIETTPAGASVALDGAPAGRSPLTLPDVAPGLHSVQVALAGHVPVQLDLELRPGISAAPLRFALAPLPASPSPAADPGGSGPRPAREGELVPLTPDVVPPRRLGGEAAPFPEAALKLRMQGAVVVDVLVSERGEPLEVRVVESAGEIFDTAVIEAARGWRFEPARKQGVRVRAYWRFRQRFELGR